MTTAATPVSGGYQLPAGLNYRNIEKYQKRQRKYSNFNRMIMPKDWRQEGFERRATVERQIFVPYIF